MGKGGGLEIGAQNCRVGGWAQEAGVSRDLPASGLQSDKSWIEDRKKGQWEIDRDGKQRKVNCRAFVLEIDTPKRAINRSHYISRLLSAFPQ